MRSQHTFFMDRVEVQQSRFQIYISNKTAAHVPRRRTFASENELILQRSASKVKTVIFANGRTKAGRDNAEKLRKSLFFFKMA